MSRVVGLEAQVPVGVCGLPVDGGVQAAIILPQKQGVSRILFMWHKSHSAVPFLIHNTTGVIHNHNYTSSTDGVLLVLTQVQVL